MALLSKLARAVTAYLITQDCGSVNDIFPYHTSLNGRALPNTSVTFQTVGTPEPVLTGDFRVTLALAIRSNVAEAPPGDPNPDWPWVAHNARIDAHYAAMMESDDGETLRVTVAAINASGRDLAVDHSNGTDPAETLRAQNNADMANFTLLELHDAGMALGKADDEGSYFEDVLLFSCLACESNTD